MNRRRRHLRSPHDDILDDDEELDYGEIRDYEEAIPRGGRGADHHLGGLGEVHMFYDPVENIEAMVGDLVDAMATQDWSIVEDVITRLESLGREQAPLDERNYRTGHVVSGNAGGMTGHPVAESDEDVREPRGPNSADDPEDVEEEYIDLPEGLMDFERFGL